MCEKAVPFRFDTKFERLRLEQTATQPQKTFSTQRKGIAFPHIEAAQPQRIIERQNDV
jgi:hypothetical protein